MELKDIVGNIEDIKTFLKFYKFVMVLFFVFNLWMAFKFSTVFHVLNGFNYLFFFSLIGLLERLVDKLGSKLGGVTKLMGELYYE